MEKEEKNNTALLDHEKQIHEYAETLRKLKEQNEKTGVLSDGEIHSMETKLEMLRKKVYTKLTPMQRVAICRHQDRPRSIDYIRRLIEDFTEIHGDRLFRDDHSMITGLGTVGDERFVIVAQEKGCDTESRLYRNFGMNYPEGYRKAKRAFELAEKFKLPVLCIIDTPGAYCGLDAEERGQGRAIADNLMIMSRLKVPIVAVIIGEGCSGGALGIGVADCIGMLEHAYYSVISPESCSIILYKDMDQKEKAAGSLKLHAENLKNFDIIDDIIEEPLGGAHHDPEIVFERVLNFITKRVKSLKQQSVDKLLNARYEKYRRMGRFMTSTEK